jgi:hypothetical protein
MIDHLVLATDDLERSVAQITRDWGITPTPGGAHVGRGTRNELVALGDGAYLEIVGPDLGQADHTGARPFGVDAISGQRLVAWCARPLHDLESAGASALHHGHDIGPITSMSRRRPDGVLLEWRLTFPPLSPDRPDEPAVLPFLIDWLHSEHPTTSLHHPVQLLELQLLTPAAERVGAVVDAIGGDAHISVRATLDSRDHLVARLMTPAGEITLTG